MSDPTDEQKAASYYKAGKEMIPGQRDWPRPEWVPKRVALSGIVRGDGPWHSTLAQPGEHEAECNQFGAVSVKATNGSILGLRLNEFKVIEWQRNPHLDTESEA